MAAKRGHRPTQYKHGIFVSTIKINHNIFQFYLQQQRVFNACFDIDSKYKEEIVLWNTS